MYAFVAAFAVALFVSAASSHAGGNTVATCSWSPNPVVVNQRTILTAEGLKGGGQTAYAILKSDGTVWGQNSGPIGNIDTWVVGWGFNTADTYTAVFTQDGGNGAEKCRCSVVVTP